jgi:GTPase Era involved in 16S rRNA processing
MDRSVLVECLRALASCSDERGQLEIAGLSRRLDAQVLRLLLVGEAKRGKSTLGNALLGRDVLPSGVAPVTAIATTVAQGSPEGIRVHLDAGGIVEGSLADLSTFVTESNNPGNRKSVSSVEVSLESVPLEGAVLVDTPGVGSVLAHNDEAAHRAMDVMDVAVFVLTADPPISLSERRLLDGVRGQSVAVFVVLNKADRLSPDELAEARTFVEQVTGTPELFVCSARVGLTASLAGDQLAFERSGVPQLLEAIRLRLKERAEDDLVESVARAAVRLQAHVSARVEVSKAAIETILRGRREDVDLFVTELGAVSEAEGQAQAAIAWEGRLLRTRLDDDAETRVQALTRVALTRLNERIAMEAAINDTVETDVRAELVELIERDVAAWREDWLDGVAQALVALSTRQQRIMDDAADAVAAASLRLLGTQTRPVLDELTVPEVRAFSFDFSPEVGWNAPILNSLRRMLRGRWRHRSVLRRLRSQAVTLVDKQVGRARSDLQQRVEAALRALSVEVGRRFEEQHSAMVEAVAVAQEVAGQSQSERQHRLEAMDAQLEQLTAWRRHLEQGSESVD